MSFSLTADQQEIRSAVARLCERFGPRAIFLFETRLIGNTEPRSL